MKNIELSEDELEQAKGASIEPTNGAIEPTPSFRWRLRVTDPTGT